MKNEKNLNPSINLEGELLKLVIEYHTLNSKKKEIKNDLKSLKNKILKEMKENDIKKAKSQIYSASWSHIEQKRLAKNKIKEELNARGLIDIYNDCLYDTEYDRLLIKRRKGGENIF